MLLDLSLSLIVFATLQPAPAPEPAEPSPADPSSDPSLEVPDLDNEVLVTKEEKSLDSLNPPPPKPKKKKKKKKAPSKKAKVEKPEVPEPSSEFRYGTPQHEAESYRWAEGNENSEPLAFAPDKSKDAPFAFADRPNQPTVEGDAPIQGNHMRRHYEGIKPTKQRFGFHFKIGPYLPEIDKEDPQGPYAKVFGVVNQNNLVIDAPSNELIYWLGFEWQFYKLGGPLSIGLDIGFFTDSATARLTNPGDPVVPEPGVDPASVPAKLSPADKNRFSMVPLAILAGYRFSYLADKTPVPLVPYVRAGMNYSFWWSQKGSGNLVRDPQGEKVRGGTLGWQGQAGLALRLDGIFRRAGRLMDGRFGINHVSLFGEFSIAKSGLGGKKFNLGDKTYYGGLLVEF